MKGRVTKCKCSAVRVIAVGRGSWGGAGEGAGSYRCAVPVQNGSCGCLVAVQIEGRAEWDRWLWVDQVPHHLPCPHFLLFQMFSSQQTFTEYFLCTRYALGTGGGNVGSRGE